MPSKQVWTEEESRSLRFLKEDKKIADWDAIALILNENSKQARRSGKQCRYHYLMYARFAGEQNHQKDIGDWTQKENTMLFRLFGQFGCKWTYISYHFPSRSEGNIKNKFYSSLRRAARQMTSIQRKSNKSQKNSISYGMLLNVFDIVSTMKIQYPEVYQQLDQAFQLSQLRKSLLQYIFSINQFHQDQVVSMVKRIRKINSRSRSLGIFKIKNRKKWKLTQTGLNHLLGQNQKQEDSKIQQTGKQLQ